VSNEERRYQAAQSMDIHQARAENAQDLLMESALPDPDYFESGHPTHTTITLGPLDKWEGQE
jgi:hypothetical protein